MFGLMIVLLLSGVPLSFALGGLAVLGGYLLLGDVAFPWIVFRTWGLMTMFSFIAIPLFIFMASMLHHSGVAEDLYDAIHLWMGPVPGGLAVATILACAIVAAMVGTVGAGIVLMGLIALPAMMKRQYNTKLACGTIIAGGSLGVLIPPSILFIIYGTFAGMSIGKLFIGGIGPGLLYASLFIVYIIFRCWRHPLDGPAIPKEQRAIPLRVKLIKLKALVMPIILILTVLGTIFFGIATPTEAAAAGASGAFIITAIRRRMSLQTFKKAMLTTARTTGITMWIGFSAYAFVGVYALAGGDVFLRELAIGLPFGRWGIFAIIQIVLIVVGMFMDWVGILVLAIPIVVPLMVELGFDPLWFGIIFSLNMQMSFLTPPFGYSLFYLKGVAPEGITMTDIYRSVIPFLVLQSIGLILVILFPGIATWLPNLMIK